MEKLITSKILNIPQIEHCIQSMLHFRILLKQQVKRGHLPFIFVLSNASFNNFLHFRNCYFVKTGWLNPLKTIKTVTKTRYKSSALEL